MAKRNRQNNLKKALEKASENKYTEKVTDDRIYYTREFYTRMKELMDGGMSPIKAYKTLGYDVNELGEDRAYAAAGRAASGQARKPKKVSGMVPRNQVGNLSDQEMVDYLNSRIDYLETVVGVLKKKGLKTASENTIIEEREVEIDKCLLADTYIKDHSETKISEACKIFEITTREYRRWKNHRENPSKSQIEKAAEDERIKEKMIDIIKSYGFVPGRRQLYTSLAHDRFTINGQPVGEKRIARLMKEMNLYPTLRHKDAYKGQATYNHPYYDVNDYVRRNFRQDPRKVILTDITYISYNGNKRISYLCVFKDAFTNEILGWHISRKMDVTLVEKAYCMMMDLHEKEIKQACRYMKENGQLPYVYIHSDNGSQYTSTEFREILKDDGFIQSVSRRGNSLDNAPMESFFGRMKSILNELVERCPNFDTVETMVENYLKQYNTEIPQYDLAGQTPEEYYRYITEGIYQTDIYFGVSSKELITQAELESRRELARAERAKRRSEQRKSDESSYEYKSRQHPIRVVHKDQTIILGRINKLQKLIDEESREIERLETLLEDTDIALKFLTRASESVIESLYYPRNWQKYPELSYVNRTGAIY